ncbi:hypothetical protein GKC30_00160 [Pseudodesulfovibrio sp. F-1]|uniref:Uncharacterized protein n=1 Tax=Pseudodesulfovibrio alkaliphilus TaxID=2661613 RepID=A0A7K1KIZ0_9BACT|nr:hypothetical protein [Pseudodesulfovibrio alkaliphilus]
MNTSSANVRTMLRTYGKQLTNAKRLARFRQALGEAKALDGVDRQAKRRELVERIAREVIENLIVSSTPSPVVAAILGQIQEEFGHPFLFEYPVDGTDVIILRSTADGPQEVVGPERNRVMRRLWEITLSKVDDTML